MAVASGLQIASKTTILNCKLIVQFSIPFLPTFLPTMQTDYYPPYQSFVLAI